MGAKLKPKKITILEALTLLPKPLFELAIEEVCKQGEFYDLPKLIRIFVFEDDCYITGLLEAFIWKESELGWDFWNAVNLDAQYHKIWEDGA